MLPSEAEIRAGGRFLKELLDRELWSYMGQSYVLHKQKGGNPCTSSTASVESQERLAPPTGMGTVG